MSDVASLTSWYSDFSQVRALVFGLGVSGFSAADTLVELGAKVLVIAEHIDAEHQDILEVLGVPCVIGDSAKRVGVELESFDPNLIIVSPGIRPEHEILQWSRNRDLPVWVDIELAWRVRDKVSANAAWFFITGTNGKTTTTQLLEAMLNSGGLRARACGNIGTPVLDVVRDPEPVDAVVVEISSFQLHYLGEVSPHSAVVLNVAEDHLDWHGSFETYSHTKGKVYENTQFSCVYNVQDTETERLVEQANVIEGARAIGFTLGTPAKSQVGYVEDILVDRAFLDDRANSALEIATLDDISQIGVLTPHLMANVAAATAMARSAGVAPVDIREAIRTFRLDSHRIELVAEQNGIRWIDDSKATNPHAAAASLNSFDSVVWLVGGLLKGVDIAPLIAEHSHKIRAAILLGKDQSALIQAFSTVAPGVQLIQLGTGDNAQVMQEAVAAAHELAQPGDAVLLAPAAASMDQFKDYADRGRQFADAVKAVLA